MNGSPWGEDTRPVFMCLASGHKGPFVAGSVYHRGLACRSCFDKAFPGVAVKVDAETAGLSTQIRQQERRQA